MKLLQRLTASRAKRAVAWSSVDTGFSVAAQVISLVWVSRLLPPTDFAVFGVGAVIVLFTQTVCAPGLSTALIQRDEYEPYYGVSWTYQCACCVAGFLLLYFCVPYVVHYCYPAYIEHVRWYRWMLVAVLITGFTNIGVVALYKELRTELLILRQGPAVLVRTLTTVGLAYVLRDYRALVVAYLLHSILCCVLSHCIAPTKIKIDFSLRRLSAILPFSLWVHAKNLVRVLIERTDMVLLGSTAMSAFGLYFRGKQIADLSRGVVANTNSLVLFPYLSNVKNDLRQQERAFGLMNTWYIALYCLPVSGLLVVGDELPAVVMGEKWRAAYWPIVLLLFANLAGTLRVAVAALLRSRAKARQDFLLSAVEGVVTIALLAWLTKQYEVTGACVALVVARGTMSVVSAFYVRRLRVRMTELATSASLVAAFTVAATTAGRWLWELSKPDGATEVLIFVSTYCCLYLALLAGGLVRLTRR